MKASSRGAYFLDANGPKNWRGDIEVESLNMRDCQACILGQMYNFYSIGCRVLDLWSEEDQVSLGFTLNSIDDDMSEWQKLTEDWIEEIAS